LFFYPFNFCINGQISLQDWVVQYDAPREPEVSLGFKFCVFFQMVKFYLFGQISMSLTWFCAVRYIFIGLVEQLVGKVAKEKHYYFC
jgi:hypothetical protein